MRAEAPDQEEYEGKIFGNGAAYGYIAATPATARERDRSTCRSSAGPIPIIDTANSQTSRRTGNSTDFLSKEVIASLKKYRDDILQLDSRQIRSNWTRSHHQRLAPYEPEVTQARECLRPSNWGAFSEDTSGSNRHAERNIFIKVSTTRVIIPAARRHHPQMGSSEAALRGTNERNAR